MGVVKACNGKSTLQIIRHYCLACVVVNALMLVDGSYDLYLKVLASCPIVSLTDLPS